MNILKPLTTLFKSGTAIRDMLIDVKSQDILLYLTPETVTFCNITDQLKRSKRFDSSKNIEVYGPYVTEFGNPVKLPCDISQAKDFFKVYITENNDVGISPNLHILTDIPISLYAWKLSQQHRNIGALQDELNYRPTDIIQRAPSNRRWIVMTPYLKVHAREDKSEFALIAGLHNDIISSLTSWCAEANAYPMSIYPISLLGLQKAIVLQKELLQVYIFWGNNAKFCTITHRDKGVIFSEECEITTILNNNYLSAVYAHLDEIATEINAPQPKHSAYIFNTAQEPIVDDSLMPIFASSDGVNLREISNLYTQYYIK